MHGPANDISKTDGDCNNGRKEQPSLPKTAHNNSYKGTNRDPVKKETKVVVPRSPTVQVQP